MRLDIGLRMAFYIVECERHAGGEAAEMPRRDVRVHGEVPRSCAESRDARICHAKIADILKKKGTVEMFDAEGKPIGASQP